MSQAILQTSTSTIFSTPQVIKLKGILHPVRILGSFTLAAVTTLLLIMVMARLISTGYEPPVEQHYPAIKSVILPELLSTTEPNVKKPQRPQQQQQLMTPKPQNAASLPTGITIGINPPILSDTTLQAATISSAPIPIYKPLPRYPRAALRRSTEGYAIVEFTINKNGSVRDPIIIGAFDGSGKPTHVFDQAALDAALKFKYNPSMQNGQPTEQHGVRNRISFKLAE